MINGSLGKRHALSDEGLLGRAGLGLDDYETVMKLFYFYDQPFGERTCGLLYVYLRCILLKCLVFTFQVSPEMRPLSQYTYYTQNSNPVYLDTVTPPSR